MDQNGVLTVLIEDITISWRTYPLPFGMQAQYPFIHPFKHSALAPYPKDMKWLMWYLCHKYTIGIQFELEEILKFLSRNTAIKDMISYPTEDRNSDIHFIQFLEWFKSLLEWERSRKPVIDICNDEHEYKEFQKIICEKNGVVTRVIWPPAQIPMAWDYPKDYMLTKSTIEQALKEYNEEHPLPPIAYQDPYFPDLEVLMQLDIDPPAQFKPSRTQQNYYPTGSR
ncbi:hypothetical protein CDL15_Pgr013315 [Punica granatum]|uniref:Uncharacterized protein n=1 Tax=Punica granatum TaxID=22663 RepID=A0A218WQB6_PUNGR|nr:hypothetical protein CDL15_Pgr013315 [Punica granatum]